jgi:hypothetical protein
MRKTLAAIALALCLSLGVTTTTACYGSFDMTRSLHQWNGQATDNKFVNWLLFVGLVIIPVYEISLLVDGFVFNSIEFWTGNNPARTGRLAVKQRDDGTLEVAFDGRALELRQTARGLELYEDGAYQGRAQRHADGSLSFYDAADAHMHTLDASAIERAAASASLSRSE